MHAHVHTDWDAAVHLPLWISSNEAKQIESRMDMWVGLLLSVGADVAGLSKVRGSARLKRVQHFLWGFRFIKTVGRRSQAQLGRRGSRKV